MNCKPGDIAICINGRHKGKIGTVIAPFTGGSCGGVEFSHVPSDVGMVWIFEAAGYFDVGTERIKRGPFPDSWLRPVSGLPEADTSKSVDDLAPRERFVAKHQQQEKEAA